MSAKVDKVDKPVVNEKEIIDRIWMVRSLDFIFYLKEKCRKCLGF